MEKHLIQGTKEWLDFRRDHLGASDAPIIMGVSPWRTPYQLWQEKVGIAQDKPSSKAMKRGVELEEKARESFCSKIGVKMNPKVVIHPEHKWMMASLDGADSTCKEIVEIKCPGREDHEIAKSGQVPKKYFPQLQHQMEVVGVDKAYYYSYMEVAGVDKADYYSYDGEDGVIVEVARDSEYIRDLINYEKDFYKCMKTFIAPELSTRDYEDISSEYFDLIQEWKESKNALSLLEDKEKALRDKITQMAANKNMRGFGLKIMKVIRKGNIDYAQIEALKNINLEKYRKEPVEFMRLMVDG